METPPAVAVEELSKVALELGCVWEDFEPAGEEEAPEEGTEDELEGIIEGEPVARGRLVEVPINGVDDKRAGEDTGLDIRGADEELRSGVGIEEDKKGTEDGGTEVEDRDTPVGDRDTGVEDIGKDADGVGVVVIV